MRRALISALLMLVPTVAFAQGVVSQKNLSKPDDGYADASDPATSLLGRFNRLYGTPGQDNSREKSYRGNVGFILD